MVKRRAFGFVLWRATPLAFWLGAAIALALAPGSSKAQGTHGPRMLNISIEPRGDVADYRLVLHYAPRSGRARGDLDFGTDDLQGLRVTGLDGQPLAFEVIEERKKRLVFTVPEPTPREGGSEDKISYGGVVLHRGILEQAVVIEFSQAIDVHRGPGGARFSVPWLSRSAHTAQHFAIDYPAVWDRCSRGVLEQGRCVIRRGDEGDVHITFRDPRIPYVEPSPPWEAASAMLAMLLGLGLLWWRRRTQLLAERGVIPVVRSVVHADDANYREPAMDTHVVPAKPELKPEDARGLRSRMLWNLTLVPLPMFAALALGAVWPLGPTVCGFAAFGLAVAAYRTRPSRWEDNPPWEWLRPVWFAAALLFAYGRWRRAVSTALSEDELRDVLEAFGFVICITVVVVLGLVGFLGVNAAEERKNHD